MFAVFFWYGQCMIFSAFFLSTLMKTENQACTTAYAVVLSLLLFSASFSYGTITLKLTYNQLARKSKFIGLITFLLELLPPYQFSILFSTISYYSAPQFIFDSMSWVDGRKFETEDFYSDTEIIIGIFGDIIVAPSPNYYMVKLWLSNIYLICLWLYFDHVNASNRGIAYSPFFFL